MSDQTELPSWLIIAERWMVPVLLGLIILVSAYRFLPWSDWLTKGDTHTAAAQQTQQAQIGNQVTASPASELAIDTHATAGIESTTTNVIDDQRSNILTENINPVMQLEESADTQQDDASTAVPLGDTIGAASPETEIESAIERWRSTWQSKDIYHYFDTYRPGYEDSVQQLAHDDWLEHRYQAIMRAEDLKVSVSNIRIKLQSHDRATATFTQRYRAKDNQSTTRKTLEFARIEGLWKIVKESAR